MQRALFKLTSGKFLMTIAAALVMLHDCFTNPQGAAQWKETIVVIIMFYFQRPNPNETKP